MSHLLIAQPAGRYLDFLIVDEWRDQFPSSVSICISKNAYIFPDPLERDLLVFETISGDAVPTLTQTYEIRSHESILIGYTMWRAILQEPFLPDQGISEIL